MSLFTSRKKEHEVQGHLLKILNNQSSVLKAMDEGDRSERRLSLAMAAYLIPWDDRRPEVDRIRAVVTKDVSTTGLQIFAWEPTEFERCILVMHWEGNELFFRADRKHQQPAGASLWQIGLRLTEVVHPTDWHELESVHLF